LLNQTNIAVSSYCNYRIKKVSDKYIDIKKELIPICQHHKGRFDCRRITLIINQKGFLINYKTIIRLMKALGFKSLIGVKNSIEKGN
jgi:putative transposase